MILQAVPPCLQNIIDRGIFRLTGEICPTCGDPLGETKAPDGAWKPASCLHCAQQHQREQFIRDAAAAQAARSPLYAQATLETFVVEEPYQRRGLAAARMLLDEIVPQSPLALVLYSHPGNGWTGYGTGKTHLASAIANVLRRRGWRVESWLMPELLSRIRASYSSNNGDESEWGLIRRASSCDVLVLDDLGKEHVRDTSWYQEKLFLIIEARAQRGPLVVTTNLDPHRLAPWIGGAAFSRLWQMCRQGDPNLLVDLCGPDWRFRAHTS